MALPVQTVGMQRGKKGQTTSASTRTRFSDSPTRGKARDRHRLEAQQRVCARTSVTRLSEESGRALSPLLSSRACPLL